MSKVLRIAQLAPVATAVAPHSTTSIEGLVWLLTEELVRRGHEVTLFASGDSRTKARLEAIVPRALRLVGIHDSRPYNVATLDRVTAMQQQQLTTGLTAVLRQQQTALQQLQRQNNLLTALQTALQQQTALTPAQQRQLTALHQPPHRRHPRRHLTFIGTSFQRPRSSKTLGRIPS